MANTVPKDTELDAWKATPNKDASVHDEQQHQHQREEPSTTIKTVQNIALADATAKQKPSLWTWRMGQLYIILFLATLNAAVNGYDGSVMSSINSYAQYRSYFGFDLTEGTPATGIVYAMFTIGNLVGAGFAGPAADSPRWLVANDRHEEALNIMAKYHGEGDRSSPLVQLELREMMEEISKTGADKRWWDFRELFDSKEVRYRTMLTCAIALFGQWTGNGPVSYYYPQMLAGAGIENNHTQLLLQGMQSVLSFIGALLGAAYTDHWGRRPQLLISTSLISLLFLIILILNALNTTTDPETHLTVAKSAAASNAEIAMIFLFSLVFAVGWTPMQGLYAVEVLRYESRAKGMAVYTLVGNVAGFYNTFVTGIAFSGAGWRYYYLFVFWDLLEVAFIYFFFVETKGRTLEELTEIFNAVNPVKYSLKKSEVVIHGDEGVTEVLEKELGKESLG
ncbi:hypothetical protein ACHAPC_007519 [Botrytis cinerea]